MFHISRHVGTRTRLLGPAKGLLQSQISLRLTGDPPRHFNVLLSSRAHSDLSTTNDDRVRLSRVWAPSGGIAETSTEDAHAKLIRAGFLRQAHSGIFHMLPLGLRVHEKLERLIDKYMSKLGASKLALSSISSEEIWERSGRLNAGSELFHFKDRKDVPYLLSPTHEEEITSLVARAVKSYKELPVRLYQISRKYRDELRPRHGVLRSREFVMKDLYTFDYNASHALKTYHQVREAYGGFFDELKIPYLVAEADSGDIGGDLSHEFHFPTSKGEDHIISCTNCDYVANEELAESTASPSSSETQNPEHEVRVWRGITRDRLTLINAWYLSSDSPKSIDHGESEINIHAIKALIPGLDASVEEPVSLWTSKPQTLDSPWLSGAQTRLPRLVNLIDCRIPDSFREAINSKSSELPLWPAAVNAITPDNLISTIVQDPLTGKLLNLLRIKDGDSCPRCAGGVLKVQKAIELGHTFHLGTRYSEPLQATVTVPVQYLDEHSTTPSNSSEEQARNAGSSKVVAMQMGCHGIGISRMIGAVADTLADERGLNWPRVMAPFEVVIVSGKGSGSAALEVYDALSAGSRIPDDSQDIPLDLVLDDRNATLPWKMRDADLVGYPVIVVVGRRWETEQMCEVQCRRLQIREDVELKRLPAFVRSLLAQL